MISRMKNRWRKRALVLGLVCALCVNCSDYMEITVKDLDPKNRMDLEDTKEVGRLYLRMPHPSEVDASLIGKNASGKNMPDYRPFGSPAAFERAIALFPNATYLDAEISALPVHSQEDANICQSKELEMPKVTALLLRNKFQLLCVLNAVSGLLNITEETASSSTPFEPSCLIFESLRLFPNVEEIVFEDNIPDSAVEEIQTTNVVLSSVKKVEANHLPEDQAFLGRLPVIFPSLEELKIGESTLRAMVAGDMQEGISSHRFENLTNLETCSERNTPAAAVFSKNMANIFPALSSIRILSWIEGATISLPSGSTINPLKSVEKIDMLSYIDYPPDFFHEMFPNLDFLKVARCELKRLASGSSHPYGKWFYHPHLTGLVISNNSGLDQILEPMREALKLPQADSSEAPPGGFFLPKLNRLNIINSFYGKLPGCFFQGCPEIERLGVSLSLRDYVCDESDSWWEFLRPLKKLKRLDVVLVPGSNWIFKPIHDTLLRVRGALSLNDAMIVILKDGKENAQEVIWPLKSKDKE